MGVNFFSSKSGKLKKVYYLLKNKLKINQIEKETYEMGL